MGPPAEADPVGDDPRLQVRIDEWLADVRKLRDRTSKPLKNLEEARARLRVMHPTLSDERGLFLAEKGTTLREGELFFAFDPLHRTRAPFPFRIEAFRPQLARIAVPTLVLNGEHGWKPFDHASRMACIPQHRELTVLGAGHMMHWDQVDAVSKELDAFFDEEVSCIVPE